MPATRGAGRSESSQAPEILHCAASHAAIQRPLTLPDMSTLWDPAQGTRWPSRSRSALNHAHGRLLHLALRRSLFALPPISNAPVSLFSPSTLSVSTSSISILAGEVYSSPDLYLHRLST